MNSQVSIIKCNSYDSAAVLEALTKSVELIGGINNFIKAKSRVLVKPNLLMAKEPEFGITTHPEVVRAVIKILKGIQCKIFVGDGPSVWGKQIENVEEVYSLTGMERICREEEVELVRFDKRRWRDKFPLTTWIDECDSFVNVPKFKTHDLTLITGAIKNLFGLVSGTYKTELHKNYTDAASFSKILVDIYAQARPALTIIDGITAMEGDGPGTAGKLRNLNLILGGSDCVALDSVMAMIMGINPLAVLTTKEAAARHLGAADIDSISIYGEKLEDVIVEKFLLPVTSLRRRIVPQAVIDTIKRFIRYYPVVNHSKCIRCQACVRACPNKIISLRHNRMVFDYSRCIACFCCQEICPSSAIKVKKSLLAKIIGL